jgi:hypothetical protein
MRHVCLRVCVYVYASACVFERAIRTRKLSLVGVSIRERCVDIGLL